MWLAVCWETSSDKEIDARGSFCPRPLMELIRGVKGGRIVIAVGGIPYCSPPAPLEFAFSLEEWLHKQGLRQRTEIEYLFPLPRLHS